MWWAQKRHGAPLCRVRNGDEVTDSEVSDARILRAADGLRERIV